MPNAQISPISQLLHTLGITKEDLEKRSNQMRQFLTAEDANSLRVADRDCLSSASDLRSMSQSTSSASSITHSRSRTNSYSCRDSTPPTTPIKSESVEGSLSLRHFDSMEMVIERQRRQNRKEKKERRERERESMARMAVPHPPSPSPSNTSPSSFNLDMFMHSRDGQRVVLADAPETALSASAKLNAQVIPPVTPQRSKYYRDHTALSGNLSQSRQNEPFTLKAESPTPTQTRPPSFSELQSRNYAYPQYLAQAGYLPSPFGIGQVGALTDPVTPQHRRTYAPQRRLAHSPLPPSSPPPVSSPVVTPNRRVVNLVSSPGPMGPLPDEEEYDTLPYTLPPGPYSPNKPDLSYAALVGRAILSSPDHRLTLQEIYDWITIVFPHFKRGEQTWMNSIRHVLSTTVCFRKVPRERSIGRTQWAIFDEDLECFKGGGFRKQLCKDIMNGNLTKDKQAAPKAKKGKKRTFGEDDNASETRGRVKRSKKDNTTPLPITSLTSTFVPTTMASHPLFPPTRPTPHHQPYYQSCLPQQPQHRPGDIIFPPLPPGVGYSRYIGNVSTSSLPPSSVEPRVGDGDVPSPISIEQEVTSAPPSTVSSIPELIPNCSSSSPLPASGEMGEDTSSVLGADKSLCNTTLLDKQVELPIDQEDEHNNPLLGAESLEQMGNSLQPGIKLSFSGHLSEDDDVLPLKRSKSSKRHDTRKLKKRASFPPIPTSPTFDRRAASKATKVLRGSTNLESPDLRSTPPPSTPPRNTRQLPTSSLRTPLAEKDLSINPAALNADTDNDYDYVESDAHRTPRKRLSDSGLAGAPVTPRRLIFPANQNDSPYRTPGYVYGTSPFRTPGSRTVFDPHDPATLLDEELSRMGASGHGDSPAGLFGKARGSLLYDSPGLHSPSQWQKWW
ncbi:hypothetical protein BDZ94DRAFT_1298182 [Collybia nuda]|uniref:Fork-head domain-containing protein n=1 Tax=Collybia nuda TaxID=64659 RepID=A0A9P5Y5X2_9AGAR|nr:hypothetical protein BDZ94DRAFT_1298182 [Collybia nuda]